MSYQEKLNYYQQKIITFSFVEYTLQGMMNLKTVDLYIVYDLPNWPKNSLSNFTQKIFFFGATNLVKNNDKEKY